jgi:hypothetical protein
MSLLRKISKHLDGAAACFIKTIAEKYNLEESELESIWTETTKMRLGGKSGRGQTPYNHFCASERSKVLALHPDMTFSALSTHLAASWKGLSDAEKATYAVESNDPAMMSRSRLLALCADKGVKVSRSAKKEVLLRALEGTGDDQTMVDRDDAVAPAPVKKSKKKTRVTTPVADDNDETMVAPRTEPIVTTPADDDDDETMVDRDDAVAPAPVKNSKKKTRVTTPVADDEETPPSTQVEPSQVIVSAEDGLDFLAQIKLLKIHELEAMCVEHGLAKGTRPAMIRRLNGHKQAASSSLL